MNGAVADWAFLRIQNRTLNGPSVPKLALPKHKDFPSQCAKLFAIGFMTLNVALEFGNPVIVPA